MDGAERLHGADTLTMKPLDPSDVRAHQMRLANYPLFEAARPATVTSLVRGASYFACDPGQRLCTAGAPISDVHWVLHGVVRLFHVDAGGNAFTAKLMAAPNHIGDLQRLAGGERYGGHAECLTECVVAIVPYSVLRSALDDDHQLALAWLSAMASQFAVTIGLSQHNLFSDVVGRIAHFLLSYSDALATVMSASDASWVAMSRDELAKSCGAVRRSAIRAVQDLETAGAIHVEPTGVRIVDRENLRRFVPSARLSLAHSARNHDVDRCA